MRPIAFNGKFLAASPTGVHRVAGELIRQVDALIGEDASLEAHRRWELVKPRDARLDLGLHHVRMRTAGRLVWQPWEQIELPIVTRDAVLVSLCNLAPLSHPRSICMIHDAQVFLSPQSYRPAFRKWYQFALPQIGRKALRILTVSQYSKSMLAQHGIADESKIDVVYNGVDHLSRTSADPAVLAKLKINGPFVVALSTTQAHKNVALLVEAFRDPLLKGVRLILVGAATAADFEAQGVSLGPAITFAGKVSDAEMRALFESAAALAFPSRTEGFGLPPLEAMYFGCPAIVAPCGALPEVCGDAVSYVDPDDASGWAREIARLVEDDVFATHRREAGERQARKFAWRAAGERLVEILRTTG